MTAIRLSPSGPTIKNGNGGELAPGDGSTLRRAVQRVNTTTSFPNASQTTELRSDMNDPNAARNFRATLENVRAGLRYIARVSFDLVTFGAYDGGSLAIQLQIANAADQNATATMFLNQAALLMPDNAAATLNQICTHVDFESEPFDPSILPTWQDGDQIWAYAEINLGAFTVDQARFFSTGQLGTARMELLETF